MYHRKSLNPAFEEDPSFDRLFDNFESIKLNCFGKNVEKALNFAIKKKFYPFEKVTNSVTYPL